MEAKKRGRPKGSKNKTHLLSAGGDADGDDAPPPPAGRRTRPVQTFMENVVTQCHNAHTLYHSRKRPDGQSPLSPPKPRPNASTLMLQSGRACDWAERHHLEADPAGVKKCVMCTKEGKRFRCVTRCSNEELCRNAHVCIQHFVAFHNASPIAKIDAGSSDEECKMRSPPSS